MSNRYCRGAWGLTLSVLFLLATAKPALAEQDAEPGRWTFGGQLYLWGAGIDGTSVAGDDIDISFSDLVNNLDFAFMATLAANRDKWSLFADLIYLDVSDDTKTTANLVGRPISVKVDVGLKGFITTLGGAYRFLETDATRLNVLAGARYLSLEADLKYDIAGGLARGKFSESGDGWDGVVGLKGRTDLNDKWYLSYYADVGTGYSDLTWQALAGINYRFSRVDATLGYRYLAWEFDDDDTFDDLNISGPYAGIKFRF